jgi:O-antigen/teichoic acid export membrane protein
MQDASLTYLDSVHHRTARNAMALAIATILARGIQFMWILLLARLLQADLYGLWGTISALLVMAATLPDLGIGLVVLRDIPQQPGISGPYLTASLVVQPCLAIVAHIIVIGLGSLLSNDLFTRQMIALAGCSLILDTLGNIAHNQLLAAEQMVATSTIGIVHGILQVLLAFVVLALGGGLPALYVATLVASTFRATLLWLMLQRAGVHPVGPLDIPLIARVMRQGSPIALNAFLNLVYQHLIRILIFVVLTRADAGYFTAAYIIIFGIVDVLNVTVLTALFPAMSRLFATQPLALRPLTNRLALLTLIFMIPIGIAVTLLSANLTEVLFPGFIGTARVLQMLIWFAILAMVGNFYAQSMIIQRRQQQVMAFQAVGLITSLGFGMVLLPSLGISGAGLAVLIPQCGVLALLLWAHRTTGVPRARVLRQVSHICLAGAIMAIVIIALREANVVVAAAAGLVCYSLTVLMSRVLSPEDWQMLQHAIAAVPMIGPSVVQWRLFTRWQALR